MQKIYVTSKAKQKILLEEMEQRNFLHKYKFMTKQELFENMYFKYDKRAIFYIMEKYLEKPENAVMYLENMMFIESKRYQSDKLNQLVKMKKELEKEQLLIKNPMFSYFLQQREIIIDEPVIDKFYEKTIEQLREVTTVVIKEQSSIKYTHDVYEYLDMEEEVNALAKKIGKLLEKQIDINKIKIVNASNDYIFYLKRIFSCYHIPIELKEKNSLYGTALVAEFLKRLDTMPTDELIEQLREENSSQESSLILNQLVELINEYSWYDYDFSKMKALLIYDLKQLKIPTIHKQNTISCVDLEEVKEDDYVFFIGFNTDTVPIVKKDEAFLTDVLQEQLGFSKSFEWNKLKKQETIRLINSIPHLIISYKLMGKSKEAYPSSLLSEIGINKIRKETVKTNHSYSVLQDQLNLARMLDQYGKYGTIDSSLPILYSNYQSIPYKTYQHQFTGIEKEKLQNYLKYRGGFHLSYSHLNTFMKCHFRYYLDRILKLDQYEESFTALVGSYFHKVLERMRESDFDLEQETKNFFQEKTLSNKENFLLIKLVKELQLAMKIVLEQESLSHHNQFFLEERIEIEKNREHIPITMKGFIDKIMLRKADGNEYISLIDYKTGSYGIDLNGVIHGLNMQLPVYAYLVKHSNKFQHAVITGFYIAPILVADELVKDEISSFERTKEKMKLVGYSNNNESILEQFDITYRASEVIRGMKTTSKGFGPHAKILSQEQIDALVKLVETKIDEAITDILNGEFSIHPKRLNDKDMSCDFCPYQDICFKSYEDYIHLEEQSYKEFLGGEL